MSGTLSGLERYSFLYSFSHLILLCTPRMYPYARGHIPFLPALLRDEFIGLDLFGPLPCDSDFWGCNILRSSLETRCS